MKYRIIILLSLLVAFNSCINTLEKNSIEHVREQIKVQESEIIWLSELEKEIENLDKIYFKSKIKILTDKYDPIFYNFQKANDLNFLTFKYNYVAKDYSEYINFLKDEGVTYSFFINCDEKSRKELSNIIEIKYTLVWKIYTKLITSHLKCNI